MSEKRTRAYGDETTTNRSGLRGRVIRSEKLSLPWADRFVIVDEADKSHVLDDCCGYGYQSKRQALDVWGKTGGGIGRKMPQSRRPEPKRHSEELQSGDRQHRAAHWLSRHPAVSKDLFELVDFAAKAHFAVNTSDVQEILMQNDITVDPPSALDLLVVISERKAGHGKGRRSISTARV